ncbi:hypothetical protein LGM71_12335 [Burkholderia sp. AU33545]|uniref:DUF6708 domain-containing protein n=1 Tax=Burkholderia sp. AU33545 TaxID=2879631 RepID=UPI001CF5C50B|nr:DUF6708 domain-containing protein [Burkholderia sp. AU33545]MCA8201842.1 hypothetical protein [Burkholderia sp. AU33545]
MTTRPKLNPPTRGWQADLPEPNDIPNEEPSLDGYAFNHLGGVYLELPRSFMAVRGVMFWLNVIAVPAYICLFFEGGGFSDCSGDLAIFFIGLAAAFVAIWTVLFTLRLDISPPRDLPLRFNRLRRKMYVYEIDVVWWNPFIRWPIRAVAYDWDDVRAEAWQQQGAINGGHTMKWGVVLSIVKSGTNEVIDRFQLGAKGDGEAAWAYICTYMQEGPAALPPPDDLPFDHDNKRTLNIAYLLAPKVKWPAEMDLESRTAPTESSCRDPLNGDCSVVEGKH